MKLHRFSAKILKSVFLAQTVYFSGYFVFVAVNCDISYNVHIPCSGGFLSDENRNCLIGGDAQRTFENIYADMAFFSVKGISSDQKIVDCSREEILVRNAMLKNAETKVLLCDSTKFEKKAAYIQCHVKDVDYLISDGNNAQRFAAFVEKTMLL